MKYPTYTAGNLECFGSQSSVWALFKYIYIYTWQIVAEVKKSKKIKKFIIIYKIAQNTIFKFDIKYLTFNNLADAFIQSYLQMKTIEAIKTNKRAMICKCYD